MIKISLFPILGITLNLGNMGELFNKSITLVAVIFFLLLLMSVLRAIFRKLPNDLPLVAVEVSRIPLVLMTCFTGIHFLLPELPAAGLSGIVQSLHSALTVLILVIATYWIVQLVNQVLVYGLKQYAEQSEAMWDDVVVPIIEVIAPLLIYLVGGLLVLQTLGVDLSKLLLALGGIGFILGFALKDILANFFSGLVLLIDTPFSFGDVISLGDNERAIIRKIGLRVTKLYLIDSHAELYIPNGKLESDSILNLSRPTNHYYYTVSIPIKGDVDPARAIALMQKVVLAHPGTMGDIGQKLGVIDRYYGYSLPVLANEKRESGKQRLIAEQQVSRNLDNVETALANLAEKLGFMEKGGLDGEEIRLLRGCYLEICEMIGLELFSDHFDKRRRPRLVEASGSGEMTLIESIRQWYKTWITDPDLFKEDIVMLPRYWEQKLGLLKSKANKVFRVVNNPTGQETRVDNLIEELRSWMKESFKSSRNEWQDPKVLINEVKGEFVRDTTVKFYIDDIKLEHCERGNRIKSEVRQELIWHLRQEYLM
ncbi:Low conductance mechanosensitive channel YnaI [Planktothrix tepida]|uniref:Small-conductance mechanosensitive channel n=2 Tax=Planktothrix TaxID=54304 RepID=A0A1J1LPN0_9CYAN|nr:MULTISPECIES: mechanosensitive ion channel family protein [Planktothrix]CAD5937979.1 Low conductance mechanosensitive channel YnaI [Planktothrix pseudagardhii]CAD5972476.1 Low conductance mechanosensitive channel YnaI [Planktothrix tepida]CUR34475.1 Small-conductance mechanosensitive channel [Planktothrix tepida PCC 9214]